MGKLSQKFRGDCAVHYFHGVLDQGSMRTPGRNKIIVQLIDRYGVRIVRRHIHQLSRAMDNIEREFWYG